MSKVFSKSIISLSLKVIAKEYCDWIWQTWSLHSSMTISLSSSLPARKLVFWVSSERVTHHFEYLCGIQRCMMSGPAYSLICLMCSLTSKKPQSRSHPSVHSTLRYLGLELNAASWQTFGVWCRFPLFTPGNKNEMHNFLSLCFGFFFFSSRKEIKRINPAAVVWCKWKDQFLQFLHHYRSFVNVLSFKRFILLTHRQIHHTFINGLSGLW